MNEHEVLITLAKKFGDFTEKEIQQIKELFTVKNVEKNEILLHLSLIHI